MSYEAVRAKPITRHILMGVTCIKDGRVRADVRGAWPILFVGMCARQIETYGELIDFIIEYLA